MKKLSVFLLIAFIGGFAFAAKVSEKSQLENRIITEGEFAILYCNAINAQEPEDGWTFESAIMKLTDLKIYHPEGWRPNEDLVEGIMVELVRYAGIELVTPYPDRKVTVARANAVFIKFNSFFNKIHPEYRTVTGEPATYIEYEGNPGYPMTPSNF